MTVPSATNKSGPYTGNGVTTVFPYGFRILDAAHIQVVRTENDVDTILTTGFTVSGVGDAGGGNVTFSVAPTASQKITLIRNAPFLQETDLENQGAYYAETIEDALDLGVMRDQQLQEQINRSLKIPVGQDASVLDALIEDVIRLADSADEIDRVAGIEADVVTVAGIDADITTVAGIAGNVTTVAGIAANVTTVAGVAADVTTVAGIASDVSTVAVVAADVPVVAAIDADVTTVAAIASDVQTAAANVVDITNFADVYLGPSAANPTTRQDASPLQTGDLYFNTAVGQMRVYDGATWVAASSSVNGTTRRQSFTATSGQTVFAVTGGYDAGFADVYLNGLKLVNGDDVDVSSGSDVVLTVGATLGDSVDVVAYGAFEIANVLEKNQNLADLDDAAAARGNLGLGAGDDVTFAATSVENLRRGSPVIKTSDFTVAASENWLINNKSGSACVVTLPAASGATGREIMIQNLQAQAVNSASSNVVTITGGAAAAAILPAVIGSRATLVSDGTNWRVVDFYIPSLGEGQTWTFVTGSRSLATTYTNTTGRPIAAMVRLGVGAGAGTTFSVNGSTLSQFTNNGSGGTTFTHSVIIPAGATYLCAGGSIADWAELR